MLANSRRNHRNRRGVVLVLVLGMLALMALIGITFATFSGQSRISARNYMQSMNQPQRDELMDYALSQLICDTPDVGSAIRGHSMARDMYGNDAYTNGYLPSRPDGEYRAPNGDPYFYITGVTAGTGTQYLLTTNIPSNDSTFYGYSFTRWNLRVSYLTVGLVDQTLEILADSGFNSSSAAGRVFTVNIGLTEGNSNSTATPPILATALHNPTQETTTTLPGQSLIAGTGTPRFILDGRWLHAFNGPGMTTNAVHANFRYNGLNPNSVGMDEDYDAVDLENWFLAMQSADGSVMIPSFHRPSAIRIDTANGYYDWGGPTNTTPTWNDSASRILRPRAADGNDASAFPDLVPGTNGQITYDVDNDGDGITDSVWLDLGYPARRNAQGQLYKPLFAFMVIGLNGRIPLNTAGNLAGNAQGITYTSGTTSYTYGGGAAHAAHLGNSVSEVDPTYALQNSFDANSGVDLLGAFNYPPTSSAMNTQVDTAGIDVRLTQLRNLLAGTRPPQKTSFGSGTDGDTNYVSVETALGSGSPNKLFIPNGVADPFDTSPGTDANGNPYVLRLTPPVAGRWGEAGSIPGGLYDSNSPSPPAINNYLNLLQVAYNNPVRAGYSYDVSDAISTNFDSGSTTGLPRDAADDNYNAFDPFPLGHNGELNDSDAYDLAGALILPVDRMRRYVTPADINGTGSVTPWTTISTSNIPPGADPLGRVLFKSYFRPPGSPGSIASSPSTPPTGTLPATVGTLGAIYYPSSATGNNFFYTQGLNNNPNSAVYSSFLPDVTNNPLHAFEFFRLPPTTSGGSVANHVASGSFTFQFTGSNRVGGAMPVSPLPPPPATATNIDKYKFPISYPTYNYETNSSQHTDGLNDADEMNLYVPNPQADSPLSASDLEWLYRQQDVDGATLTSRLAQLAPVSFTNPIDAQRRRRLFSLDGWEMNNFVWANDNPPSVVSPGGVFPTNSRFTPTANAGFTSLNVPASTNSNISGLLNPTAPPYYPFSPTTPSPAPEPTPPLAHRDKKINLNYPLPVSNNPNEPIRQKWISDAYQLMKSVLPPKAVDTPDELAALSQFLVNVIDFRDPDCTMTHFRNPDVELVLGSITAGVYTPSYLAPINSAIPSTPAPGATAIPLDQYGMEYSPVAINEAMAYSYPTNSTPVNRFFVELVNTLSRTAAGVEIDAGATTNSPDVSTLDLSLANYDMVITADDPVSRPDPFTGQLLPIQSANYYSQIPLNQANVAVPNNLFSTPGDVKLPPVPSIGAPSNPPAAGDFPYPNYFFVIGSPQGAVSEKNPPTVSATLSGAYDPLSPTAPPTSPPSNVVPPGYCKNLMSVPGPQQTAQPVTTMSGSTMPGKIPLLTPGSGAMQYYWICLRRPANPFAPPWPDISSPNYNPMVVVDAMRFPYTDGGVMPPPPSTLPTTAKTIISCQRCQPFRGGHAVRLFSDTATTGAAPLYTPYGYSEQMAAPQPSATYGTYDGAAQITLPICHTLNAVNNPNESWDYFPFNDRDFTSVAELMLVPGCPPGLFTKQFVELAPLPPGTAALTSASAATSFPVPAQMPPNPSAGAPTAFSTAPTSPNAAVAFQTAATGSVVQPHTYPYLVDKFFYSGYGGPVAPSTIPTADPGGVVDGPGADGWFKMFEFFEVPSQSLGSIGPVAQGTDFDWARQDTKPGLLNINLIIDEEVFFSILGSQQLTLSNGAAASNTDSFTQLLLNFAELPALNYPIPQVVTSSLVSGDAYSSTPVWGLGGSQPGVVTNDPISHGGRAFNGMKAAFAQFLVLRHGANVSASTGNWLLYSTNAERPFHSVSYPDINYTVMRPATLPPASTTYTGATTGYSSGSYTSDPGVRNPYINPASPPSGILNLGVYSPNNPAIPTPAPTTPSPYGTYFNSAGVTSYVSMPSPIPARRLFQIPDAYGTTFGVVPTVPPTSTQSNASDSGDPFINVVTYNTTTLLAAGALAAVTTGPTYLNNGYPNLVWSGNVTLPTSHPTASTGVYLGSNNTSNPDNSQHPYWRSELMQKVMNLTTVRTHQYAVWITIGFFEVKREGDLGMIAQGVPLLAYDLLGPEIGAASGQTTRYRGFFLVDRTKLYGFDDTTPGSFTPAVVYRQMIE